MSSSEMNCIGGSEPRTAAIHGKPRAGHSIIVETILRVCGPSTIAGRRMSVETAGCSAANACALRSTSPLCFE